MNENTDRAGDRVDDDNPEWTGDMFRRARPASEVLPQFIGEVATATLMRRSVFRSSDDDAGVITLPPDVVEAYAATGQEWRELIVRTLRDHMPSK